MQANAKTTVLIAAPNALASRHEASRKAITSAVMNIAESTGGRCLNSAGGRVMALFATPDAAASAASRIHAAVAKLAPIGGTHPGVHIGFHTGPVHKPAQDLIDDTVKLAWRLTEQAEDGQTVTSRETAEKLNPALRSFSRCLHQLHGANDDIWLYEVASWHQRGVRPQGWSAMAMLRLTYREQFVVCSKENGLIDIGRGESCDLVVESKLASRSHCAIAYDDGRFVLRDHSSNGTFVRNAGSTAVAVASARISLPDQGLISIGEPNAPACDCVEFSFALVT
jgi:adenylate cyclase